MRSSVIVILCIIISSFNCSSKHETQLESLIFTKDMLPEGCSLKIINKEDRSKIPANLHITSDSNFVKLLTDGVFGDTINSKSVERILFSVYQEEAETGVFAFHFKDLDVAEAAETSTRRKNYKAILRKGHIVVLLWDDGTTKACSNRMMHLVLSALEITDIS